MIQFFKENNIELSFALGVIKMMIEINQASEKGTSHFLHKLAVKRCAAGKGVSAALLDYAKAECEKRNIST